MENPAISVILREIGHVRRRLAQDWPTVLGLFGIFVAVTLFRLLYLLSQTYPPGGDVAEQLYQAHIWLGTVFPSAPATIWQIPPLYTFLVYLPLTSWPSFFTGAKVLIAVTPALLVFPSYWFVRMAGGRKGFALFGGALVGLSSQYSAMVSWNAGATATGIFFALFFLAELVVALRTAKRRDVVLASISFGLVAGTHFFTFLFVVIVLLLSGVLTLALVPNRRLSLRAFAYLTLGGILASLAFVPIYYTLLVNTTNVGPASAPLSSDFVYNILPIVWGFDLGRMPPLAWIDVVLSVLAVVVVVGARLRTPQGSVILASIAAAIFLAVLYPGNYIDGLLYLPGILALVVVLFADLLYAQRHSLASVAGLGSPGPTDDHGDAGPPPGTGPTLKSRRRAARVAAPTVAGVLLAIFLVANAAYSYSEFQTNVQYYTALESNADVNVLDWLAQNTTSSAHIYVSSPGLATWVLGYSNRLAYSPRPLQNQVTQFSYQASYNANLVGMGQYVTGNGFLAVAENLPAWDGAPSLYVQTSYGWVLFATARSYQIDLIFQGSNGPVRLGLQGANVTSTSLSYPCAGCSAQDLILHWPGTDATVDQSIVVSGQSVTVQWKALSGTLESVEGQFYIPPDGWNNLEYGNLPNLVNVSSVDDRFSLNGQPFSMKVTGDEGNLSQGPTSSGWTGLEYQGSPGLTFSMSGIAGIGGTKPYSVNASALLLQMGVNYLVADESDQGPGLGNPLSDQASGLGYSLYLRCSTPEAFPALVMTQVYQNSTWYVYSVSS